jgi:hypothetical protein
MYMKNNKPQQRSSYADGSILYETVYSRELRAYRYFGFDPIAEKTWYLDHIDTGEMRYIPPQNNLAESGAMLFAEQTEEYGSFTDLLSNIRGFLYQYLDVPDDYLFIASAYVILTWVFDQFETIPYLRARGDYGTGKSRFLKVIGSVCYRPLFAGGSSTTSPIFRLIDLYKGLTLILDEADFRFSGADAEIVKILNTGYQRGMGVLRTEGDKEFTPRLFQTFGPKILATREEFEDKALESRCLTNYMVPTKRTDVPLHLDESFYRMSQQIRNQLLKFRLDHYKELKIDNSLVIPNIEPRVNQVVLPLLSLADTEESRQELIQYAIKHGKAQKTFRALSIEATVLIAIVKLSKQKQYIPISEVSSTLNQDRSIINGEYAISPAKIGRINRTAFDFKTRMVKGKSQIVWDEQRGKDLISRFDIREQVEDVEDVDNLSEADVLATSSNLSSELPQELIW